MEDQLSPNSNIERAVLAAIIFDPDLLDTDYRDLKTADFIFDFNKRVFRAIRQLQKAEKPIEEEFIKTIVSKSTEDEAELLEIISTLPISSHSKYKEELKNISKNYHFTIEKAKILEKNLSAKEEIRELSKLFDRYKTATVTEPLLNIVNSKNVMPETPVFFLEKELPIQKNEITMLTAGGGSGKSFVALWTAAKLVERHNLKVFAYLSEDSVGITRKRFDTIKRANYKLEDVEIDYAGKEKRPKPFLVKQGGTFEPSNYLEDFKALLKNYDVIILDPLIAFILEDENDNVEARAILGELNEWCENENKTIIVIHHNNKDGRMRGASAFVDAIRIHYEIENPAVADKNHDKESTKTYNYRTARMLKTNHFPAGAGTEFKIPLFAGNFEISYENEFGAAEVVNYEMPDAENKGRSYEEV